AYRDVKGSPLAAVDVAVRGAALEGIGLALEGKGDAEGALKSSKELEGTNVLEQKELGMYQQARILYGKGDIDKAKELLTSARDHRKARPSSPSSPVSEESHPFGFLESQIDDLLRRIDPNAVVSSPGPVTAGSKSMSPEDLQRLQEQLQRKLKDQKNKP